MQTSLLLEMAADTFPDRNAFGTVDEPISFNEIILRVSASAQWLAQQPGDKMVFIGLNGWIFPTMLYSSALAGKPITPLNYRLADADLNKLLTRTVPSVAVVDDDMISRLEPVDGVKIVPRSEYEAVCTSDEALRNRNNNPMEDNDIALLLFTSGTTGDPKTAVLRHRHLTSYIISTLEFMSADEDEAALVSVPPYHIAGVSAVLSNTYIGRRVVYMPAFSPEDWVEQAIKEKITHAMVVPTMLGRILDLLEEKGETLPHLKALSYGGGRMPQPVIERALEMMPHVDYVNAYGLTETSSTISVLSPDDHRVAIGSDDPAVRKRIASVGKPIPTLELEIRDPDGKVCGPNEAGEVYVRGEQVSGEYLHKTALESDGWFPTNDAGWLDDEGYLFVDGRLDDVIVRGGENISPGEIEDVLRKHEAISDIAVLGIPCAQWGEKVAAVIVRKKDVSEDELATFVRATLRSTKTPEYWEFREELPYNETGKLLRRVLKKELSED